MNTSLLEKLRAERARQEAVKQDKATTKPTSLLEKLRAERARQEVGAQSEDSWTGATPAGSKDELPEWTSTNPKKQRFYDQTRKMFDSLSDEVKKEEPQPEKAETPDFKVENPLHGQVARAVRNVIGGTASPGFGGGVSSVGEQVRDFTARNIVAPDLQQRVAQVAKGDFALPESKVVENEQTGERLSLGFHTPTAEEREEQEQRAETIKSLLGEKDTGSDDVPTLLGEYLPAPDANGNVNLDGKVYPADEIAQYADEYVKDREHNRRFKEDDQYRNEWFLQHTGMSAERYRSKVANELEARVAQLAKNAPQIQKYTTSGVAYPARESVADQMIADAGKTVNTLRKNNFWSGAAEGTNLRNLLTLGFFDVGMKASLLNALNKAEKGERLTPTEQFYIDTWQLQQDAEQYIDVLGGRSMGASIGRGGVQTLEFVGQIAATGGIAGAATKGISRAAAKAMLRNAVQKGIGRKIASGLEVGALKLSQSVVGAAARTPFQALTYDVYTDKRLGQFEPKSSKNAASELRTVVSKTPHPAWKDALYAGLESWAESHSEDIGMWLNAGMNSIGKRLAISRLGQSIGMNSLKGVKRSAALEWLGREGKIAGLASETLGEAYGDALVNLFEGDREGWRQMMTKDYWWELGGVTLMLTGSFGALNLPAGISQARRNASLERVKQNALAGIENEELKSRLAEAGGMDNLAARSKALSGIDWRDKRISKMDAARAVDFINAQTALDIRQGEQSETERLERMAPILERIAAVEYKGADGKSASGEAVFATTQEGLEYFVLAGDLEKGPLMCLDSDGKLTTVEASSIEKKEKIDISDLIANEYVGMFGTQEEQQYLDRLQTRVEEARAAGVDAGAIDDIIREAGLTVYAPGDDVTTVEGREGVVSRTLGGRYEVLDEAGKVTEYGFNDILQPDAATAQAQQTRAAEEQRQPEEETQEGPLRPEVEEAVAEAARQTEAVKNLDDDAVWSVTMSDGRPASIIKGANVAYDPETGEVDYTGSDATVVVRYADGQKKLVSIRDVLSVDEVSAAVDVVEMARQAAEDAAAAAEAGQPAVVGEQTVVRLTNGEEGVIEGTNEDGTLRFATMDETGRVETRDIRPEDIAREEPAESDGLLGRSLTDEEARAVVAAMQGNAVPAPQLELTPENWDAEFGSAGVVATPIGEVKMGENQYLKMAREGRKTKLGMIKPTLTDPFVIIEDASKASEGSETERPSSLVFVKPFIGADGSRSYLFTSVTIRKDGQEVVISNQEKGNNKISKLLQTGKVAWINSNGSLHPKTQIEESVPQSDSRGHTLAEQSETSGLGVGSPAVSVDKHTTSAPEKQIPEEDIPRLKNGQPDYNAMTAEQLAPALLERFGADRSAILARNNIAEAEKRAATIEKQIAAATDPNKLDTLDRKLQETQAQRQKYMDVLDLLGLSVDATESQEDRTQRLKQENTPWIVELFPEGLPNVESVILADIASGKKIRWTDKTVNGAVVSRGLGKELGLGDSPSERRARFGLLANEAPTPEEYAEELPERLAAMGIRFDEGALRDQVIDVYGSVNTRREARQALELLAANLQTAEAPADYEEVQQMRAYEAQQRTLREAGNNATFVETPDNTMNDGTAEERADRDNDGPGHVPGDVGRGVAGDATRTMEGLGDRSDIRVFEEGLGSSRNDDSEYSARDRQEAEGQRLINIAKRTGKYIDPNELAHLGKKHPQRTGESVVYIDKAGGKVYKVKNPYAKAALKNGVPEDAIYEHLIHNRLFPETKYTLEGITEHLGDVRIVLSQDFIPVYRSVSTEQVAAALAEKGFVREDPYTFGNDLVSVTDVEGDNVLPGDDGTLYFIDPIIKLKRPAREVLDELEVRENVSDKEDFREPNDRGDEVPFSITDAATSAPEAISPERWNAVVDQLRQAVGAENVVTDPAAVRAKYEEIVGRDEEARRSIFSPDKTRKEKRAIKRAVKADGTYLKSPNGKPTKLSPEQWLNVRTQAFKEWFGDWENDPATASKVVDENGEPQVVYHGTNRWREKSAGAAGTIRQFHIFNTEHGAWFAKEPHHAAWYAEGHERSLLSRRRVYSVFLNIRNPKEVGFIDRGAKSREEWVRLIAKELNIPEQDATTVLDSVVEEIGDLPDRLYEVTRSRAFKAWLQQFGFDGISALEDDFYGKATQLRAGQKVDYDAKVHTYSALEPQQIKSATRNSGLFDAANPDIRYFRTPQGEVYGFTFGGVIYLDGARMNVETPVHEYTELWSQIVARENPKLWDRGVELMKQTKTWEEVNADVNYKDLSEELRVSETLSRIVAADFARKAKSITDDASLLGKLRAWLRQFWGELKATFSKWTTTELAGLTPKEFARLPLRDFVEGIDLRKYRDDKTLAGVHNITPEKLKKALRQGGFANPSAAVLDVERQSHEGYGEISLILPSSLVDKTTGRNAGTWSADAWTPTYPVVERQFGPQGRKRAEQDLQTLPLAMQNSARMALADYLAGRGAQGLAYMYLQHREQVPEPVVTPARYSNRVRTEVDEATQGGFTLSDALPEALERIVNAYVEARFGGDRAAYDEALQNRIAELREQTANGEFALVRRRAQRTLDTIGQYGFDYGAVQDFVREVRDDIRSGGKIDAAATNERAGEAIAASGLQQDFADWLEGLDERYAIQEVLFDGYTPAGDRKYVPNTLENASRLMRRQGRNGTEGLAASFQNFAAGVLETMGRLENIRSKKSRLTDSHAVVDAFRDKWTPVFFDLGEKLQSGAQGYEDYGLYRLAEAAGQRNPQAYIRREYGIEFSDEDAARLQEMVEAIRNDYPAMYFETKFERPVFLEEFAGAVVPENTDPKILSTLDEAGVPYRTYAKPEERAQVIRDFTKELVDVRFMRQIGTEAETSERRKSKNEELIDNLRRAIRDERHDVRQVAHLVGKQIRRSLGKELIDVLGKREFDALIRQIEQAVQRRDAEAPLKRIAEIVFDLEIKRKADKVKKLLELRIQGETPRGVSIAKNVDDQTREFIETLRNNLTRPAKEVMDELYDRGASLDAKMGAALLENYQAADEHLHEIADIEKEIADIKARNTQLRRSRVEANKAGQKDRFESLKEKIRSNVEQIEALEEEKLRAKQLRSFQLSIVAGDLEEKIFWGQEIHNDWLAQRELRKSELLRTAFDDCGDGKSIPVLDHQPSVWEKGWAKTKEFFLAPTYSFNYLLKMISVNAPNGEGALYDHFMRSEQGYVAARGKYYEGYKDFKAQLDRKARELFGKGYAEVLEESNHQTDAVITIADGKGQQQYSPTVGEALYIYMVDKMSDGRAKLRKMGIGEQEITMLADMLPKGYVRFADWIQKEFLPQRRKTYNDTHLEVFGSQMAEIENYVPLRIQKSNVYQEVDGTKTDVAELPSAITGSIIRRKRNNATLNLHTNALDLLLDHGNEMEHWNAFTRIVQDTNALLSSTNFRRLLDNRNPGLHRKLKIAAQIAADSYRPETNTTNKAWVSLSKMAASSKIAFRVNTAIKQVLSYPAFYAYSTDPKFWGLLTKNLLPSTWGKNFRWCLDNVPSFNERWLGRMAGNEKLAQMTAPQLDKWVAKMGQWGMFPNALVDALTCANGAKAVYDYRRADYLKRGLAETEAERRAKIDAALSINETQQSSEGMFLSQLQVERDFWSVSLSTFQNSNFAYLRKTLEGIDELRRDAERERQKRSEYYKAQDISDAKAWDAAVRDVVQAKRGAVANILTFMFMMNVLWGVGNNVWKYLFAEDGDDDMGEELAQSALLATVRNTTVGSAIESIANGHDLNPSVLLSDLVGFIGKVRQIVEQEDPKAWDQTAAYIALQMLTANGLGIDMNTFVGMYEGVAGMLRDGANVEDVMLLLNAPKSQTKLIAGEPKEGETLDDYQRRQGYIERRIWANVEQKQLDKWARNYTAYRQAEALGWPTVRDKQGRVEIPRLKELDDAYKETLKAAGLTASGNDRPDAGTLTEEQRAKFKAGFSKRVYDIYLLQNRLAAAIVFNEAYAEEMRRLVKMKQAAIEEWNDKKMQ